MGSYVEYWMKLPGGGGFGSTGWNSKQLTHRPPSKGPWNNKCALNVIDVLQSSQLKGSNNPKCWKLKGKNNPLFYGLKVKHNPPFYGLRVNHEQFCKYSMRSTKGMPIRNYWPTNTCRCFPKSLMEPHLNFGWCQRNSHQHSVQLPGRLVGNNHPRDLNLPNNVPLVVG